MKIFGNRWVLLTVLALTWGSSFILIKKSLLAFTPYQVGAVRITLAGLVLLAYGLPVLRKLPRRTVGWMMLAGICGSFIPMFMFPLAQTRVSSSTAGVLNALMPVFVLVLGFLFFGIKSRPQQKMGAILGFAGAALLLMSPGGNSGSSEFGYAMLAIVGTVFYAISALIIQSKLKNIPSLQLSAGIFALILPLGIVSLWMSGFFSAFNGSHDQWVGMGYIAILSLVGTALAAGLFFRLIQMSSAVFAGAVTYLIPVVAAMWGAVDGEHITVSYILGMALVFLGIYLIREKRLKQAATQVDVPAP